MAAVATGATTPPVTGVPTIGEGVAPCSSVKLGGRSDENVQPRIASAGQFPRKKICAAKIEEAADPNDGLPIRKSQSSTVSEAEFTTLRPIIETVLVMLASRLLAVPAVASFPVWSAAAAGISADGIWMSIPRRVTPAAPSTTIKPSLKAAGSSPCAGSNTTFPPQASSVRRECCAPRRSG